MGWYAVRSIFKFGKKQDGTNIFEERIVVFQAVDADEAFSKAEVEAANYAKNDGKPDFEIHPDMELYEQDGDPLIDGYEVWSQLFEAKETMDVFFHNRYEKYKYHREC